MLCQFLGSSDPLSPHFNECDLVKGVVLCGGQQAWCECPNTRKRQEVIFPKGVATKDPKAEDELIREAEAHQEWLEICDHDRHVSS